MKRLNEILCIIAAVLTMIVCIFLGMIAVTLGVIVALVKEAVPSLRRKQKPKNKTIIPHVPTAALNPPIPIYRFRCPFRGSAGIYYGEQFVFRGPDADPRTNACALECAFRGVHAPCRMEVEGILPDWNRCPFNSPENQRTIEQILRCICSPAELPPNVMVTVELWMEYVMSDRCPHPNKLPPKLDHALSRSPYED